MRLIDAFEKDIGMQVAYLNQEKFIKLLQNKKIINKYFSDDESCQELLTEISNRCLDTSFKSAINIFRTKLLLVYTETKIDKVFESYRNGQIQREELLKEMEIMRADADPIVSISAVLCTFLALSDVDLSKEKENILNGIEGLHRILGSLANISESYSVRIDLINLIFELGEWYFSKYEESLTDNLTWMKEELEKLNSLEGSFLEDIPDAGVSPESLGYIDITKVNRKE